MITQIEENFLYLKDLIQYNIEVLTVNKDLYQFQNVFRKE